MSSSVRGAGGGSTAKELVNAIGEHIAELEKVEGGAVTVPRGLGNATTDKVLKGASFTSENGIRQDGSIPLKEATTIKPATTEQIIESGQYLDGELTIEGDVNLVPENIKEGTDIFGVTGSVKPSASWAEVGTYAISASDTYYVNARTIYTTNKNPNRIHGSGVCVNSYNVGTLRLNGTQIAIMPPGSTNEQTANISFQENAVNIPSLKSAYSTGSMNGKSVNYCIAQI